MTRTEEFEEKQMNMSDNELIELAMKEISNLAKSYGNSHHMSIPPLITDTDMILGELARRFKNRCGIKEALEELVQVKIWKDKNGKDEHYLKTQPVAWENAIKALENAK